MPFKGDINELRRLKMTLEGMASQDMLHEVAQRMSGTVLKLSADGFKGERDPYGDGWQPLKRERKRNRRARKQGKKGGQKILQDTGRMRAAAVAHAIGARVELGFPAVEYAIYHQDGRGHNPVRMIVPRKSLGLGPIWNKALGRDVRDVINDRAEKRRR